MAVTMTTTFYDESGASWKDLSKIVFTSPNMDSPNTAGTRSHILPGQGNLGLWYEDTTNMYRIEPEQLETEESYLYITTSGVTLSGTSSFNMANSVAFEVTFGECYNCRLTAWDDVSHSTTVNELIAGDHVRCSAISYNYTGSDFKDPDTNTQVHAPVYNRILKGNTTYSGIEYYYGDFDMVYQFGSDYGDFLIFKPMLYGITDSISYGVHDFVITLSYSYT